MHEEMKGARRQTRAVRVGDCTIGGGSMITVQSMTTTPTQDATATLRQIDALVEAGCDIVRVAVPDTDAAAALPQIVREASVPLVADIHFDYRLALAAIDAGVAKVRVNPGTLGDAQHVRTVARALASAGIAARIGVNAGSLPDDVHARVARGEVSPGEAMGACALAEAAQFEDAGCHAIVLSVKAARVPVMCAAYRYLARMSDYPLHLGVTEAGAGQRGVVFSSVGIGALLAEGIGDTLRVSLTGDPVEEVRVGRRILQALELRAYGPDIVSCPTCGRCAVDVEGIVHAVEAALQKDPLLATSPCRIAIMGCVVNGPGEARDADVGFAGGKNSGVLFARGEKRETIDAHEAVARVVEEVRAWTHAHGTEQQDDR